MCDYLTERKQQGLLNVQSSSWTAETSGVPRGSVLGPLLFGSFVNDLLSIVRSPQVIFVDDAKIYHSIQFYEDYITTITVGSWQFM